MACLFCDRAHTYAIFVHHINIQLVQLLTRLSGLMQINLFQRSAAHPHTETYVNCLLLSAECEGSYSVQNWAVFSQICTLTTTSPIHPAFLTWVVLTLHFSLSNPSGPTLFLSHPHSPTLSAVIHLTLSSYPMFESLCPCTQHSLTLLPPPLLVSNLIGCCWPSLLCSFLPPLPFFLSSISLPASSQHPCLYPSFVNGVIAAFFLEGKMDWGP